MKIVFRHLSVILLAFLSFANLNVAFAGPCETCLKLERGLAKFGARKDALKELLERNRTYLEQAGRNGASAASIQIKTTSNIFMITVELETIENNEQRVQAYLAKLGCSKCLR
jgi:hypothetical protein